ncbi:hypothetical protein EJB05_07565 [Eragrostis curvula]|uniref:Uncharacterized protein n=1 Tax=Eragrostis curvula TaxID=38414 RepID=A0A5J9WJA7_9POAL|nr:hypothetical protein EJB05_07565 [Eragrostis curvula]
MGRIKSVMSLLLLLLGVALQGCIAQDGGGGGGGLRRGSFPEGFVFGTASAAYQRPGTKNSQNILVCMAGTGILEPVN